jgi:putative acetyltransferase
MNSCEIIEFEDRYQPDFKTLNAEWLYQYNLMEDHDLQILDNPRHYILDTGGVIYLARHEKRIVGSAALIHEHDGIYELVKMAVDKDFRNMGISKLLIERCLEKARELGASRIELFSNHQLKTALGLYEKYGFKYVPVKDSPFVTADVKMELVLA